MRILSLFIALQLGHMHAVAQSVGTKVTSSVVAVTVYNDRALVTRTFRHRFTPGTHIAVFPNLPSSLVDNSLRVAGTSESRARVLDVQVQSVFLDTIPEERVQAMNRQLQQLRDERVDVNNRLLVVRSKSMTLEALVKAYAEAISKGTSTRPSTDEWERILQYETRIRVDQAAQITALERELRSLDTRIRTAEQNLLAHSGAQRRSVKQVKVTLDVRTEGDVSGEVSYVVMDASWNPAYEMRFRTGDTVATLTFAGEARQSTGEDWRGITLTLSTALPSRGAGIPPAIPWKVEVPQGIGYAAPPRRGTVSDRRFLIDQSGRGNTISGRIYDRESGELLIGATIVVEGTNLGAASDVNGEYTILGVPTGFHTLRVTYIGYASVAINRVQVVSDGTSYVDAGMSSSAVQASEVVITAERPLIQRNTTNTVRVLTPNDRQGSGGLFKSSPASDEPAPITVGLGEAQQEFTSTSFRIGVPSDIPSDGIPHRVTVAVLDLPTAFEYVAVPARTPYVHLAAKVINGATYPLLGGTANVFTDGAYVSTTPLPPTLPNDTLRLNVGADEAFRSSRKLVRRFVEDVGTFSKRTRYTYEIQVSVQSSRPRDIIVEVIESLPTTSDERITVHYLEPEGLAKMIDHQGILRWKPTVRSGSTETLTLRYAIEFPKDKFIPLD